MTYTFKLSRRMAVLRNLGMTGAMLVLAACSADDMAGPAQESEIEQRGQDTVLVTVTPDTLIVETNQVAHFNGQVHSSQWDSVGAAVEWEVSGGTITKDGFFQSASAGTFKVVGRGRNKADTAVVVVVPPQPTLVALEMSPATVSLVAGAAQGFAAVGRLSDSSTTSVGVTWSADGGVIDASGHYTAGSSAGTYRVIAKNTTGTIADTAVVTVTVPAPAPAPAPAPTLTQVVLNPSSASLSTGASQQFAAYGRMSNGDSVAVSVSYSATGGTVTSGGLFTAGQTGGSFRVIAMSASGLADTAAITLTAPAPAPVPAPSGATGIPFGTFSLLNTTGAETAPFTLSLDAQSASTIASKISTARSKGVRMVLAMTGGAHDAYLTNGVFDRAKWNAKMDTYNTSAIKTAIAAGVADGTIIGASVMDEPHVSGEGDGNTWGPTGTMTKVRVDSLCGYVKAMFPTLPTGVVDRHDLFEPTKSYRVCDLMISQYSTILGSVTAFRDAGLAMARRDGMAIAFSMNILDGGTRTTNCVGTGGVGTFGPNCRMTAQQVRDVGLVLGPAGCGLLMWRYDATFMSKDDNKQAFNDIATQLATAPAKSCKRA